jgi:GxxExxY protein
VYYPTRSLTPAAPPIPAELNTLTQRVIGAAIKVHRHIGPGLLESVYEGALCVQLAADGLQFLRQVECPIDYLGHRVGIYRFDLLVESSVLIEIKSVDGFERVHVAQVLTYLKATKCRLGLLINFNVPVLRDGVRRIAL